MTLLDTTQPTIALQHLVSLYDLMKRANDYENAQKILDLYEKLEHQKFVISFTGHFSAGKSSMINALLGEEILPKSPIPTSANIVEIMSGDGSAKVHFIDQGPKIYQAPYDIELIKDFCKDKQTVKKIELSTTEKILPDGCILVDTPGIDAADDADRVMTESSLHLVDRLFYVMDYNHVQSEINLLFLKQIQDKEIPFYIIINQIDKHNDQELSFAEFERSVKHTFEQWQLKPEEIFYSTLMQPDHVHNQYVNIKDTIFSTFRQAKALPNTISAATLQIIEAHKAFLQEQYDQKIVELTDASHENTDISELEQIKDKVEEIQQQSELIKNRFQTDLEETLKNAYLMPASLRDLAAKFLESEQKDFKVGFFGSKKKTEAEKAARLSAFLEELQKTVEATIQWKLRDKIIALLTEHDVASPHLLQFTEKFAIDITADELRQQMKPGAKMNGNYILNYTNDVSYYIKAKFKNIANDLWEHIQKEVDQKQQQVLSSYEQQLSQLEKAYAIEQQVNALKAELAQTLTRLDEEIHDPQPEAYAWEQITHDLVAHQPQAEVVYEDQLTEQETVIEVEEIVDTPALERGKVPSIDQVVTSIDQTVAVIDGLSGFSDIIADLLNKKDKLKNRTLTVALFGAFSAGKSSFANALIGESVLPSSPNPTTAVINRIAPVTDEHPHGTIRIKLKDEQLLLDDLSKITKDFSPPKTDLDSFIHWIKEQNLTHHDELDHIFQAYLQAVVTGYEQAKDSIGETINIGLDEFAAYVTDETKACYIELVTMYYDCALTRLGITLVDTPGSNSVNARHTNVAFDYIKYADAILYVTYYNHALSRADKDFLMQLGRVKDAFQLDKMFFIINAADLAHHEDELKLVQEYVEDQLLQLGIRFPKIFPVSSKQSLHQKLKQEPLNEKMQAFEESFYQFVNEDLAILSIESALWDIKRAYEWLGQQIESALLIEKDKDHYRNQLHQKQTLLHQKVEDVDPTIYHERILQRIERQLHYVGERFRIRFHDMFKDMFNPATINESGQKAVKQVEQSLKELLDYTGYELLQEMRAVSIRVEAFIKDLVRDVYDDLENRCQEADQKFLLPMIELNDFQTPDYEQAFLALDVVHFQKALRKFRGTKAFFEKNEKELMKEELYTILEPYVDEYIQHHKQLMETTYIKQWQAEIKQQLTLVSQSIERYINHHLAMMTDSVDINLLKAKQHHLREILETHSQREARP